MSKNILIGDGMIEIGSFFLNILMCGILFLILRELKKVEKKIDHPDERPKHERLWGWGRKNR